MGVLLLASHLGVVCKGVGIGIAGARTGALVEEAEEEAQGLAKGEARQSRL